MVILSGHAHAALALQVLFVHLVDLHCIDISAVISRQHLRNRSFTFCRMLTAKP